MKSGIIKNYLLYSLPYVFVFIAALYRPWDSDLGWHLKYGEYFFQNFAILKENIYSSEMAGYAWPNTNWLTDVITYAIFSTSGFLGLTLASAIIVTLTFWAFSKAYDLNLYQQAYIFPFLIVLEEPINSVSFRGQLISIFFLGLLFLFLEKLPDKRKLLFIPLLFVVWVNTHGQFILGLGILGLYIGFKIVERILQEESKYTIATISDAFKANKLLMLTFVFSAIAGVVNPFGFSTYQIALSHFNSSELQYIMEYLPIEDLTNDWWKQMIYGVLIFFGMLAYIFTGKVKESISKIGIVSIFFVLAFLVRRYAWSMYYLGIPLLKPVADFLKPDSEKNAVRAAVIMFAAYIAFTVYLKLPLGQFHTMNWEIYCHEYTSCSEEAIKYVRDNQLDKNMMSMYNWGGYMIWNYPEIKPSIDGRMTVWKDPQTGYSPLTEYYAYEQGWDDIDDSKYDVVLMGNDKEIYTRLNELTEEGKWEKKFEDQFGGVFTRIKNSTGSSEFEYRNN